MRPQLNHTIVSASDPVASAVFLAEVMGFEPPVGFGHFMVVEAGNGVSLDYRQASDAITRQHYAFLVTEQQFDEIFGRVVERGLPYWADPGRRRAQQINHHDGGRGVYFPDPDGHSLEIITRPYGSGPRRADTP
jgi:catechol 2,3-dioxygenase-like lactoylglutathione lyase family enzyme